MLTKLIGALIGLILILLQNYLVIRYVHAAPIIGPNHDGSKYAREIEHIEEYTEKTLSQIDKNIKDLTTVKMLFERIDRQVERVINARKNVIDNCQNEWNNQNALAICIATARMATDTLEEEFDVARDMMIDAGKQIIELYSVRGETPKDTAIPLSRLQKQKDSLEASRQKIITALRARIAEAKDHYVQVFTADGLEKYKAKIQPFNDIIVMNNFLNDIEKAGPVLKNMITASLASNRFMQAINRLTAMEWAQKHWVNMAKALPTKVQMNSVFIKRFEDARKKYDADVDAARGMITGAEGSRALMIAKFLPLARKEVTTAKILSGDRTAMLGILDQADKALEAYKTSNEKFKLQTAEVLGERVAAWLTGEM